MNSWLAMTFASAVLLAGTLSAHAEVLFDHTFTSGEGFSDALLGGQQGWDVSGWTGTVDTATATLFVPQQNGFLTKSRFGTGLASPSPEVPAGSIVRFISEFSFRRSSTVNTDNYFWTGFFPQGGGNPPVFHPNQGLAGAISFNQFVSGSTPEGVMKIRTFSGGTQASEGNGSNADYGYAPFSGDSTSDVVRMTFEVTKTTEQDVFELKNTLVNLDVPGPETSTSVIVTNANLYTNTGWIVAIRFTESDLEDVTFDRLAVEVDKMTVTALSREDVSGVRFVSEVGKTCRLEYSTDGLIWLDAGATAEGTGGEIFLYDPEGEMPARTYRVVE